MLHLDRSLALSLLQAQNKLDNLHRVEVLITNEKERTAVADLFANAPKLQHVTILSGFPYVNTFHNIALPWSQLSSLLVSPSTLSCSFIEALGSAVMLERLEVRCCILDEAADSQTEIACNALLPRLRHMATSHPKALGFLHLPVVEKLICDESFTTQLNFPEVIWDMFCQGRSAFASLTSLTIFDNRKRRSTFSSFFQRS